MHFVNAIYKCIKLLEFSPVYASFMAFFFLQSDCFSMTVSMFHWSRLYIAIFNFLFLICLLKLF